jgi:ATP-dependent DNA helicase RecG
VTGKTADWNEFAKDCIAFANATGGRLLLGIEDEQDAQPPSTVIPADLPDAIRRKIAERTVNVSVLPTWSLRRTAASTSISHPTVYRRGIHHRWPLLPACGRPKQARYRRRRASAGLRTFRGLPWETQTTLQVPRADADPAKVVTNWSAHCEHPTASSHR